MNTKKKVKVFLEDVDITAIAMTSDLGACSQMNEPYILKSKDLELTEEQISILKKIGEYDKLIKQKKENDMSTNVEKDQELKVQNDELKKKLDDALDLLKEQQKVAVKVEAEKEYLKVEKSLDDFKLEDKEEIANVIVKMDIEDRAVILKAFTALKEFEITEKEETDIQKILSAEKGADGDAEGVEKSINDRISSYRKNNKKEK